ncbi:hypothetical protein STAS_06781 [Striga asiatica]|uniref:Uncharacterized protein n=1 Tax=Striga asiatica TaxID=4170 RepID=A0A5A7PE65_STRAF|nr:hypothetical protein STAS_06781 [Striga asiatica]
MYAVRSSPKSSRVMFWDDGEVFSFGRLHAIVSRSSLCSLSVGAAAEEDVAGGGFLAAREIPGIQLSIISPLIFRDFMAKISRLNNGSVRSPKSSSHDSPAAAVPVRVTLLSFFASPLTGQPKSVGSEAAALLETASMHRWTIPKSSAMGIRPWQEARAFSEYLMFLSTDSEKNLSVFEMRLSSEYSSILSGAAEGRCSGGGHVDFHAVAEFRGRLEGFATAREIGERDLTLLLVVLFLDFSSNVAVELVACSRGLSDCELENKGIRQGAHEGNYESGDDDDDLLSAKKATPELKWKMEIFHLMGPIKKHLPPLKYDSSKNSMKPSNGFHMEPSTT